MGVPTAAAQAARGRSASAAPRPKDRLAWFVGLLVVAAAHVSVSLDAVAPVQTKDEIGYLAAARWFATGEGAGLLTPEHAGGYAVGWGLLTAPLWWLSTHPPTVYAASVAVNVGLAVLLLVPATTVARRTGLSTPAAVLAAVVVCLGAGRLGYTGYALPETLLTLQLTTVLWLLLRLWGPPPGSSSARDRGPVAPGMRAGPAAPMVPAVLSLLAVLLAWLPTTHARMLPVTLLAAVSLASWSLSRRSPAGAAALVVGLLGAAAGWWLNGRVEAVLYGDVARTAVAAEQVAGLQVGDALALAVGHAWYAAVAWLGLSLLGWWVAVVAVPQDWRARVVGPWTWLAVGVVLQVGVGAAYLSGRLDEGGRVDQLVYGRYGDPLWFVVALVGAATVLSAPRAGAAAGTTGAGTTAAGTRRLLALTGGSLLVLAVTAALAIGANADRVAGFVQLNVPGVQAWAWRDERGFAVPWWQSSLTAAVVAGLLGLAVLRASPRGRSRVVALVLAGGVLLGLALVAEHRNIEPRDAWIRSLFGVRELVEQRPGAEVLLLVDRPLLLSGNGLQWWLADRATTVVEPPDLPAAVAGATPGSVVVGPTADPPTGPVGAPPLELVGVDGTGTYGVWLVP
ncbi:hypothetical protein [Aquipuribacter sp. MA13-6]|uniref:hypothetical protein n=1 Tax=unclassified Aquipuribacter TaxID=2635084 RepID=UPI003EE91A80